MPLHRVVFVVIATPVLLLQTGNLGARASSAPGVALTTLVQTPADLTVGQVDVAASIKVTSTAPIPIVVAEIAFDPACGTVSSTGTCGDPNIGALRLSPGANGAGTGCPGASFALAGPDAEGRYVFLPSPSILILPGASCTVTYSFDVVRGPTSSPVRQVASVSGFATVPFVAGTSTGTAIVAVNRATPSITLRVSPAIISVGAPVGAAVMVAPGSVGASTSAPTGMVSFASYGPSDPTCAGPPVFSSSSRPLVGAAAQAEPFTPRRAGTYRSIATYSGDGNYAPVSTECADPRATIAVGKAATVLFASSRVLGNVPIATADVEGGAQPTGSLTFTFFGPGDSKCARPPVITSPRVVVNGDGRYDSADTGSGLSGGSFFVAHYGGDADNLVASSSCTALASAAAVAPSAGAPAAPVTTTPKTPAAAPKRSRPTTGLGAYDPFAHPRQVVALEVSAFALLSIGGASGAAGAPAGGGSTTSGRTGGAEASGSRGPGGPGTSQRSSQGQGQGQVVSANVDNTEGSWSSVALTDVGEDDPRRGDRSWTWRWPGTQYADRLSRTVPVRVAPASPLVARVVNDGGYLRAVFGSSAAVFPLLGIGLGLLAVGDVHGRALPPPFWLAMALAMLGVLDALAGFIGVVVFVSGVIVLGGLASANAARTLLGLSALWFVAPIIAGAARPLRREPTLTPAEHFDRFADIVIASLVGAWAVEQILEGLPGLSGLSLPIASRAGEAALVVLAALAARMVLETMAAHWYPRRLRSVQQADLPGSSLAQHLGATTLTLTILLFVAVSYLGVCWQLFVGGALFLVPQLLRLYRQRFPNSRALFAVMPKGIVKTVLLLVVGALFGAAVLGLFHDNRQLIRDSFVLLSLPGFALALLELFGREGNQRQLRWHHQVIGTFVLATGVLFVVGVVSV